MVEKYTIFDDRIKSVKRIAQSFSKRKELIMENNELITNALRYINKECKNSELTIENIAVIISIAYF